MQDSLGSTIEAGDVIACTAGIYGGIIIGRVANLTEKGLAYTMLGREVGKTRKAHAYLANGIGLISSAHRGEDLETCSEKYLAHRHRPKANGQIRDAATNTLAVGDVVTFGGPKGPNRDYRVQRANVTLRFGQIAELRRGSNGAPLIVITSFDSGAWQSRSPGEVARLESDYHNMHPQLVHDLLGVF